MRKKLIATLLIITTFLPSKKIDACDSIKQPETYSSECTTNFLHSDTTSYLVVTKDVKSAESIKQEFDNISVQDNLFENKNVVILNSNDMLPQETLQDISHMDGVLAIEEDFTLEANNYSMDEETKEAELKTILELMQPSTANIPQEDFCDSQYEWNIQAINMNEEYKNLQSINVAILDSGICNTTDINVVGRKNYVDNECISVMYEDIIGHGTSIASIIASKENNVGIKGINPFANIYSVKVLDNENKASVSRIIESIYWCIDNDIDIINMSFGTSHYSMALEQAIQAADDAGIIMIASAGNTGNMVTYPAAFEEVIAVGAVDSQSQICHFSAKGENVNIFAPGTQIKTTNFFNGTAITEGTSIAAAHVTGAASIIMGMYPELSKKEVTNLLVNSAKPINGSSAGLLDIDFAMQHKDIFVSNNQNKPFDENELSINNNQPSETFNVDYVVGQWHHENHAHMDIDIASKWFTQDSTIIAAMMWAGQMADLSESNDSGCFHARLINTGTNTTYNCVADLSYLYELVRCMANNPSASIEQVFLAMELNYPNICYDGIVRKQMIKDFIREILATPTPNVDNSSRTIQMSKIMGLALHLAQDIYAHRTLLVENDSSLTPTQREKINKVIKENKAKVTLELATLGNDFKRSLYEDNPSFMPMRYRGAEVITQYMLVAWANNMNFNDNWLRIRDYEPKYNYHISCNHLIY